MPNLKGEEIDKLYESDLESFPDYQTYCANLNLLRTNVPMYSSQKEIASTFLKHAVIFPSIHAQQVKEKFNERLLYRARMNINTERDDLALIKTYSYPPSCYCEKNGRANLKGKSVFYCSNNPIAAVLESKPIVGETGYLSVWQAYPIRDVKIGLFLPRNLRPENFWHMTAKESYEFIDQYFTINGKDKSKHFIRLHEFIAEQFAIEKEPYAITSWMCDQMLFGDAWKDCIIYPSVLSNQNYCNLAFGTNFTDQFIRFKKVIEFTITRIDGENFSYTSGRIGELINSKITFRTASIENEVNFRSFSE